MDSPAFERNVKQSEPLESLVQWIGSREVSLTEALAALQQAERCLFMDLDNFIPSLTGILHLRDRRFMFGIRDFYFLHRNIYDSDDVLGVAAADVALFCLHASRYIEFVTGEFSFHNALAFCLEKNGRRPEAYQHDLAARMLANKQANQEPQGEFALFKGRAILLDPFINRDPQEETDFKRELRRVLTNATVRGRQDGNILHELYGWQGLAVVDCNSGNPQAAVRMYREAIRCARQTLGPVSILLLHGDLMLTTLHAKEEVQFSDEFMETIEQVPPYLACHAILIRTANLCKAVGLETFERKCRTAATRCLSGF